jgi:outer membrane biosynthesis protein TonB
LLGIAAGALLLAVAVWIGLRSTNDEPTPLQPAAVPAPPVVAPAATENITESKPAISATVSLPQPAAGEPATSSSVLNEVLPTVPEKIQSTIQGRIYVTVRVLVDPAGNVMGVLMEDAGPSKYFARTSDQAAREWQFVPADTEAARVWLLRFEYTRNGVSVRTREQ